MKFDITLGKIRSIIVHTYMCYHIHVTTPPPTHTHTHTAEQQPTAAKSDAPAARPSVTDLIDELNEVEDQVGGGRPIERDTTDSGHKRLNITASTATMELDELMQNLSKFEPNDASAQNR